jgi:ABC-type bacteriocin/lantibiotic exporter with double-glycine peptidase domain
MELQICEDDGLMSIIKFINDHGCEIEEAEIIKNFTYDKRGVNPSEIENALNKFKLVYKAIKVEGPDELTKMSYPALAYLNHLRGDRFTYCIVQEYIDEYLAIYAINRRETIKIPEKIFLNYVSNIFFCSL